MHTMQTSLSSPDRITIIIDENRDFIEMLHNPLLVLLLFSTDSFTAIAATAFLFTPHTALLGVLLHCSELFFFLLLLCFIFNFHFTHLCQLNTLIYGRSFPVIKFASLN